MNIDSLAVNLPEFSTQAVKEADRLVLTLHGTADTDAKSGLDTVLAKLHEEAIETKVPVVRVDLRAVEFMNSTCLKAFLTWLRRLRDEAGGYYEVELRTSSRVYWQRRSVQALVGFAPDHVKHIED